MAESIDRFRRGLWNRESVDRPPVGVAPDRSWLPVKYLKADFLKDEVRPEDLTRSLVRTDYEDASFGRRVFSDDWLPYNAAWRAIPWLEAISGCHVPLRHWLALRGALRRVASRTLRLCRFLPTTAGSNASGARPRN